METESTKINILSSQLLIFSCVSTDYMLVSYKRRAAKLPTSFILMQMELHTHIKIMYLKGKNILIKFRHN